MIGPWFTWSNGRVSRRLDRVLTNEDWITCFPQSQVKILPPLVSDHCAIILNSDVNIRSRPKPFKFFKFWCYNPAYSSLVEQAWGVPVGGSKLIRVCRKLQELRGGLKKLNREQYSAIGERVKALEDKMALAQMIVMDDPSPSNRDNLEVITKSWQALRRDEEIFLFQKARDNWVTNGDNNSSYFHKSIKVRQARNFISILKRSDGTLCEDIDSIAAEAVSFCQGLLGECDKEVLGQSSEYFGRLLIHKLSPQEASQLIEPITAKEVRDAMFSINSDKSPGPDGYTAHFFKSSWGIVGPDIIAAVQEFFQDGILPFQVNATILALVPKVKNADEMKNFRPIACCNVLYKCITKIISARLGIVLPSIISLNQSAFVKGRLISDNILMAHELVAAYHKTQTSPRCMVKVDLTKAFDSIAWEPLFNILKAMLFPERFIKWITACLSTTKFRVQINGSLFGHFSARKGVRQGDPLSPGLFVIVMEVLHCLFYRAGKAGLIPYHPRCKRFNIHNLCFADDLLIFTSGSAIGVQSIVHILDSFYRLTGLKMNPGKTELFCSASVTTAVRDRIKSDSGFRIGVLPVKYLGIPLISGKLKAEDCRVLIERITARINSWKAKTLSYAGRVQLINSVVSAMCSYWMSIFLLPKHVIKDVEQVCNRFLWGTNEKGAAKAKVSWEKTALPKLEGGVGIKDLSSWNMACIARHIWTLMLCSGSIWVAWIKYYRIRVRDFWTCEANSNNSWVWKQILKARRYVLPFITYDLDRSPLWNGNLKFSISSAWNDLRPSAPTVSWYRVVWGKPLIPRHSFICWLTMQDRLPTKQRLAKWGITLDIRCCFCAQPEDRDHIFADCVFGQRVRAACGLPDSLICSDWDAMSNYLQRLGTAVEESALIYIWRGATYHIWRERCGRVYGGRRMQEDDLAIITLRELRSLSGSDYVNRVVMLV
ncbi:LINE-1 reverse transcriptase homolog [Linum perenne]